MHRRTTSTDREELARLRRENHRLRQSAHYGHVSHSHDGPRPEEVSAYYYAWRSRPASARATANADLTRRIRTVHAGSHRTCGAPRVHAELRADGLPVGRKATRRTDASVEGNAGISPSQKRASHDTASDRPSSRQQIRVAAISWPSGRTNCGWRISPSCRRWPDFSILRWFSTAAASSNGPSRTDLKTRVVLDALDMALETRKPDNVTHSDSQRITASFRAA